MRCNRWDVMEQELVGQAGLDSQGRRFTRNMILEAPFTPSAWTMWGYRLMPPALLSVQTPLRLPRNSVSRAESET